MLRRLPLPKKATESARPAEQPAAADIVVMGRVLGPYGIKGWLKARPYTASTDALLDHDRWWLAAQGRSVRSSERKSEGGIGRDSHDAWKEYAVVSARIHADTVLVELEGLTGREQSAAWRGALVGIPRAKLPRLRKGEYYWSDLIGFAVVNRENQVLGTVAGMLDTAAHAVLRVAGDDGRERLIPLVPAHLVAIDPEARSVQVDWQPDY